MKRILFLLAFLPFTSIAQSTSPAPYCIGQPNKSNLYYKGAIKSVSIGSMTNATGLATPYTYYNNIPAPKLYRDSSYTLTVVFDSTYTAGGTTFYDGSNYSGWIDFNGNDDFETTWINTEIVLVDTYASSGPGHDLGAIGMTVTKTATVTIPHGAKIGKTRMRIVRSDKGMASLGGFYFLPPCSSSSTDGIVGETEDYDVNIQDAPPIITPSWVTASPNTAKVIYPNPTTGVVNFQRSDAKLCDAVGRLITSCIDCESVDLSALQSGVYILTCGDSINKIVKQ